MTDAPSINYHCGAMFFEPWYQLFSLLVPQLSLGPSVSKFYFFLSIDAEGMMYVHHTRERKQKMVSCIWIANLKINEIIKLSDWQVHWTCYIAVVLSIVFSSKLISTIFVTINRRWIYTPVIPLKVTWW